jgi:hypothetical protein
MRKIVILVTAELLIAAVIIFAFADRSKALSDREELEAFASAMYPYVIDMKDFKATALKISGRLLDETEEALGMYEFKSIWGLSDVLQSFDAVVCFQTPDGTVYYALYKKIDSIRELVRIRKDNFMDGEVVWMNRDINQTLLIKQPYITN